MSEFRRPVDAVIQSKQQRRHLINRRNTLVCEIVRSTKAGNPERVPFLRAEANRVNEMLGVVEAKYVELQKSLN